MALMNWQAITRSDSIRNPCTVNSKKCTQGPRFVVLLRFGSYGYPYHDDVIKWNPRYCPLARGIHRSLLNSPHKGQWRGALMFSLISAWINAWVNNRETGDLRRYRAHYDVSVMTNQIMTKAYAYFTEYTSCSGNGRYSSKSFLIYPSIYTLIIL